MLVRLLLPYHGLRPPLRCSGEVTPLCWLLQAGHFLVAYLLGLPPKDYTLSALDAFQRCCCDTCNCYQCSALLSSDLATSLCHACSCPLNPLCATGIGR